MVRLVLPLVLLVSDRRHELGAQLSEFGNDSIARIWAFAREVPLTQNK
jgi:hypothetical protein